MRKLSIWATAVLAIGALAGCGGASRSPASSSPDSVQGVRAAFAAEGMPLHRVRLGVVGFKWLSYDHGKRRVIVYVFPDVGSAHRGKAFAHGSPRPHTVRHANVMVQWLPPSLGGKVHAALSKLR